MRCRLLVVISTPQNQILMKSIFQFLVLCFSVSVAAQNPTKSEVIQKSLERKSQMMQSSLVKNVVFTNIGPTVMSGRVADVAVNPEDTAEFYVGYASGGLWYTKNNGTSFIDILPEPSLKKKQVIFSIGNI